MQSNDTKFDINDIKEEEDPLYVKEIKIELQDLADKVKNEAEDWSSLPFSQNTENIQVVPYVKLGNLKQKQEDWSDLSLSQNTLEIKDEHVACTATQLEGEPQAVKKHKQGKGFSTGEKMQIIKVYKTLLEDNPDVAKVDVMSKLSSTLGVSKSSVYRILKEYRSTGRVKSPAKTKPKLKTIITTTDDVTKAAIRSKLRLFVSQNEIPTLDKILCEVNNDTDLPNYSRTTLYRLLCDIGLNRKKEKVQKGSTSGGIK